MEMNEKQRSVNEQQKRQRAKERKRKRRIKKVIRTVIYAVIILLVILLGVFIKNMWQKHSENDDAAEVSSGKIEAVIEEKEPVTYSASILSAGDIILHSPFIDSSIYKNADGTYDYTSMFNYIADDYGAADFTIVNLESTISESNYSGYPLFRVPAAIATAMKQSNVDMCLLANNHMYDNADAGLTMTMDALDANSLLYTGIRRATSDQTYFIQEVNGIKVGIFNYVYETNGADAQKAINGITVSSQSADLINSFNYDNLEDLYADIRTGLEEMKEAGVEYTIAYLHWGEEYQTKENQYENTIAQELCELGIDALIGGHPHVIQPVDLLTDSSGKHQMVCAYSMGNHISNQRQELMDSMPSGHTEDGLMVKLTLEKVDDGPVSLVAADFIPTWVYKTLANGGAEYYVLPLGDPDAIIQEASSLDISYDVENSLSRTNAIIDEGVEKIQNALPISTSTAD